MTAPILAHKKFWIIKPKAGRNAIPNPTFATGISGWSASGTGVTIEQTGDESRWGAYSLKCNPATGINSNVYNSINVVAGSDYTFSVYVKGAAGQAFKLIYQKAVDPYTVYAQIDFIATGYWQREELSWSSSVTATGNLVMVRRMAIDSADPFYVDGVQFEQESKATTFIQGYMGKGYSWEGARNVSASLRAFDCKTGGELLDLDDYCSVASVTGLGHGDWNQILTKMTSGGDLYQDYIRKSRQFSIIVDFIGNSLGEIEGNRKTLIDALRPDLFEGEMVVRYQGFAANGDEATNPVDIHCVPLPATLTDTPDIPTHQRAVLNFSVPSGLFQGAYNEGAVLDLYGEFPAEFIVRRSPEGRWYEDVSAGVWNNPMEGQGTDNGLNGTVYCMEEGPDGKIYVGGAFTNAGGVTAADYLARWNPVTEEWEAVISGLSYSVSCMTFNGNGDLYIIGGTGAYTVVKVYNIFSGTVAKTTIGTPTGTYPYIAGITIGENGDIYVAGSFTTINSVTNTLRIAYYRGSTWYPCGTGLNGDVKAIAHSNGNFYIGGEFTNATGTAGDYVCWWSSIAFHSFTELGAAELTNPVSSISVDEFARPIITGTGHNPAYRFEGSSWVKIGGSANDAAYYVKYTSKGIYLSGDFTSIANITIADKIAVYLNGTWMPLDINLPTYTGYANAILLASDGSLYLGGSFSTAGEYPAPKNASCPLISDKMSTIGVASASANTYPFMQVRGPGTLKAITNYSTGKSVMFDGLTLNAGEWINLFFDPLNLQFYGGWSGRGNLMRYIVPGSDYGDFYLRPGSNQLSMFMTGTDYNSGAFMSWTPQFWGLDGALL